LKGFRECKFNVEATTVSPFPTTTVIPGLIGNPSQPKIGLEHSSIQQGIPSQAEDDELGAEDEGF
jgi:hypothetical protein